MLTMIVCGVWLVAGIMIVLNTAEQLCDEHIDWSEDDKVCKVSCNLVQTDGKLPCSCGRYYE